jgi:hypothetical protein
MYIYNIANMPRPQIKESILKAAREKCPLIYNGKLMRIISGLSAKH